MKINNDDITFIYALIDPRNDSVRYIGKTDSPHKRLNNHISNCNKEKSHKNNWIKQLLSNGVVPIMSVIDEVPKDSWQIFEIYWIEQFKQWGFKLTNSTFGGDGCNGYKHSEESKKKMSKSHIDKILSFEHRQKISDNIKRYYKENPGYNRCGGNSKQVIEQVEIHKKYIIENLSMSKCAKHFNVGKKKIFDTLKEYDISKDKSIWKKQMLSNPKKIVLQYDLNGEFIRKWFGLMEIQDKLKYNKSNIANCCRGICKTASGYIWRYEEEFIKVVKTIKTTYNININQYDSLDILIANYKSINNASKETGISRKIIKRCCEKKSSYKEHSFRYSEL